MEIINILVGFRLDQLKWLDKNVPRGERSKLLRNILDKHIKEVEGK